MVFLGSWPTLMTLVRSGACQLERFNMVKEMVVAFDWRGDNILIR